MGALAVDVYEVQNPALCAVMQWRFCVGYEATKRGASGPPIQLAFLVAPLVLHADSSALLRSTRQSSGLRFFAEKFAKSAVSQNDVLLALHHRTELFRDLSLRGMQIAVGGGLLTVRRDTAELYALSRTKPGLSRPEARALIKASEKLGAWLGELSLQEIAFTLKVRF